MKDGDLPNWKHLRGELISQWAHVSQEDLIGVEGRRDRLVDLMERHFGVGRARAEREVNLLVNKFESRLGRAS